MNKQWGQVTVVGCGLIGASFALALRVVAACDRILGWDTDANTLKEAVARRIIDEPDLAFSGGGKSSSDVIYLAMPVKAIIDFFSEHTSLIKQGALVTDAGSTKVEICHAARKYLPEDVAFIGGHPIAGSHFGGIAHARADLFHSASYLLVVEPDNQKSDKYAALEAALKAMGARVENTTSEAHDRAMAYVSHLPQLLSSALAATVNDQIDREHLAEIAGPAYRDMTRLSASPWNIWRDIFATNAAPIDAALAGLIEQLENARTSLRNEDHGAPEMFPAVRALFDRS